MNLVPLILLTLCGNDAATVESPPPADRASVVVVVGAAGTSEYGAAFSEWAGRWREAAQTAGARFTLIGDDESPDDDHARLQQTLADESQQPQGDLWIVLIGHGTFDGRAAKFNLRGPDLTAEELRTWLDAVQRPTAVINCASSSGPFLNVLSGPGRIVVTATRAGSEQNFARFGDFLSQAIATPEADVDKDGQTSLLEAFLTASRNTEAYYKQQGRLATEHALLDDNGDRQGTAADWFQGVRAVKKAESAAAVDGRRAQQFHLVRSDFERRMPPEIRQQRDQLELQLHELRDRQPQLDAAEYDRQLEELLLKLARLYEALETPAEETTSAEPVTPPSAAESSPPAKEAKGR